MASSKRDDKGEKGPNTVGGRRDAPTINNVRSNVTTVATRTPGGGVASPLNRTERVDLATPSMDRWADYNVNSDGVQQSLATSERSEPTNGYLVTDRKPVTTDPVSPGTITPPTVVKPRTPLIKSAFLSIDVPVKDGLRDSARHDDRSPTKDRSDVRPREDVKKKDMVCHPRPESNKPSEDKRSGGRGGGAPLPAQKKWRGHWC